MRFNTNVQNICKLPSFRNKLEIITMRKLFLLFVLSSFFSCEKNDSIDILPNAHVNLTINLNLPQYQDLQIPTLYVYTNGGLKGIIIQNSGSGDSSYKAYDRACPNNDCNIPMIFDGSLKMKCPCDDNEYSIIDGAPQTSGGKYFAREYRVIKINATTLNITNF